VDSFQICDEGGPLDRDRMFSLMLKKFPVLRTSCLSGPFGIAEVAGRFQEQGTRYTEATVHSVISTINSEKPL
jgi:hypothetical protein